MSRKLYKNSIFIIFKSIFYFLDCFSKFLFFHYKIYYKLADSKINFQDEGKIYLYYNEFNSNKNFIYLIDFIKFLSNHYTFY